jgi:hypothetical protein
VAVANIVKKASEVPAQLSKTNAAWASHPSRIVIADASDCRLSPKAKAHRAPRSEECNAVMPI